MTDETQDLDAVIRRAKKLLAIANDRAASPAEAATAAAMAAKLMRKFQLDDVDLAIASAKTAGMNQAYFRPRLAEWAEPLKRIPDWANFFASKIGVLTGVRPVIVTNYPGPHGVEVALCFQGLAGDVEIAAYIMAFLQAQMRKFRASFKTGFTYSVKGVPALRQYTKGLMFGILDVLDAAIIDREEEEAGDANTVSAARRLAVAKQSLIIDAFGDVRPGGSKRIVYREDEAFAAGVADGASVSLNKGLTDNSGGDVAALNTILQLGVSP